VPRSRPSAANKEIDLELNFSGEDVQALIERLYRSPRSVISRAQAIAAAN
jgi:hypothetical protein